jgi:hypothetical protein
MRKLLGTGFTLALLMIFVLWLGSCSDDDGGDINGGGEVDTQAPSVVSVTAIDNLHVEVEFDEDVDKATAEHRQNYLFVESSTTAAGERDVEAPAVPGDTLWVGSAALGSDGKTVTLTTEQSMVEVSYDFFVSGVEDVSGNAMTTAATGTFMGTAAADLTPPEIVSRSPLPDATGVGQMQPVTVQFSEPMDYSSVQSAVAWTWSSGMVSFAMSTSEENTYVFTPVQPLALNTLYTFSITSAAQDQAGNPLAPATWSFRTTSTVDNTPPRVLSTVPADGATNVPVETNLQITFSERINEQSVSGILLTPNPGDGVVNLSPDGRTVTFDPDQDLLDDTQYVLVIPQGAVEDLAGNPLAESYSATFTTAAALATGRISGVISGDPDSPDASDPQGTIVIVSSVFIFDVEGEPPILGTDEVAGNGNYLVQNLVDGVYWPVAIKETNGDGYLDPETGDAIGAYGVDLDVFDFDPDSVVISGGNHVQDVDFELFDFSAVSGVVIYDGTDYLSTLSNYPFYVAIYDTTGFDPLAIPTPNYYTSGYNLVQDPEYVLNQIGEFFGDGTYYVFAYLDVNFNGDYDPDVEPAGFYGTFAAPTPVTLADGSDGVNIDVHIDDPVTASSISSTWSAGEAGKTGANARLLPLSRLLERAARQSSGRH